MILSVSIWIHRWRERNSGNSTWIRSTFDGFLPDHPNQNSDAEYFHCESCIAIHRLPKNVSDGLAKKRKVKAYQTVHIYWLDWPYEKKRKIKNKCGIMNWSRRHVSSVGRTGGYAGANYIFIFQFAAQTKKKYVARCRLRPLSVTRRPGVPLHLLVFIISWNILYLFLSDNNLQPRYEFVIEYINHLMACEFDLIVVWIIIEIHRVISIVHDRADPFKIIIFHLCYDQIHSFNTLRPGRVATN